MTTTFFGAWQGVNFAFTGTLPEGQTPWASKKTLLRINLRFSMFSSSVFPHMIRLLFLRLSSWGTTLLSYSPTQRCVLRCIHLCTIYTASECSGSQNICVLWWSINLYGVIDLIQVICIYFQVFFCLYDLLSFRPVLPGRLQSITIVIWQRQQMVLTTRACDTWLCDYVVRAVIDCS